MAKVSFDTVQIAFILHRLAGELGELAASKGALAIPKHTAFSRSSSPYAVDNTVFRRTDQAIFNRVAEVSDESPCNATSEVEKFVMDVAVVRVGSFVFKGVWAELDKETIGIPPALLSALMQYVRLLAIYGKTLDIGFTMEPGPPLVRTHSSSKDEQRRTITATVSRKPLPALDWINCVRNLAAGYGVALPAFESGRLKSAAVDWQIIEGQSIVRVVGDPANRIQTGTAVSPVQRVPTNNEGQVAVVVEGIRQRQQIPDFALPVNKQATIEARVQLSRMSLGQDISAIGWAGKTGPSVAAASSVLAGMIEKTSIFSPFSYPFEVTDWRVALELYFESKMTMRKPWLVSTQSWHVQATVPISLDYNSEEILQYQSRLLGDAQIELLDHKNTTRLRYDSADCKENGIGDLGRLLVAGDPSSQRFLTEDPVHIHLGIAIHDYSYNDTVTCIGPATVTIGVTNFAAVFGGAHASEITPTSYPVTAIDITDWDAASPNASPGEGSAIARKTYDRTVQWNYSSIDEKTLIELRFAQRRQSP